MKHHVIIFLLLSAAAAAMGKVVLVYDMENRLPVGHVVVTVWADSVNVMCHDTLDYSGRCVVPDSFLSVTFEKPGYYSELLYLRELTDTMWLIPEGKRLNEVIVDGHYRPNVSKLKQNIPYTDPCHKAPHSMLEFDFANLIDRRGRRDRKHLRKARTLLKTYDQASILIPKGSKAPADSL